jgi:catechol 2,3-dioxygenase-like lactoylglutathione lyase family enzyme
LVGGTCKRKDSYHSRKENLKYYLKIMTIKGSNITINVRDLDKSISFYQSIGLMVKNRWGKHYAQLTAPDIVIGLHPTNNGTLSNNSGNVSIGFTTDNFEETKSFLEKLSISIIERDEEGGQFLHFNDPDGTALYFIKPKW